MKVLSYFVSLLLFLLIWQVAAQFDWINVVFFPSPASIFYRAYELLFLEHSLRVHLIASFTRYFWGAIIAIPLAILMALLIELNSFMKYFFKPLIALSFPIPKLALFPILMIFFGIGETPKILLIAIGIFYLLLFHALIGFQNIRNSEQYLLVKIYKISLWTQIRYLLLRGAAIEILAGMQSGLSYGLVMLVAAEMNATNFGIGHFIWSSWDSFRIQDLYLAFFLIAIWGGLIFAFFEVFLCLLRQRRRSGQLNKN